MDDMEDDSLIDIIKSDNVGKFHRQARATRSIPAVIEYWEFAVEHSAMKIMRNLTTHCCARYIWQDRYCLAKWREIGLFFRLLIKGQRIIYDSLSLDELPAIIIQYLLTLGVEFHGNILSSATYETSKMLYLTTGYYDDHQVIMKIIHFFQVIPIIANRYYYTIDGLPRYLHNYDLVKRE